MRLRTLSQRLYLVAGLALVPALLIVAVGFLQLRRAADTALNEQAHRSAELAALELERIASGAENVLRTLAVTPEVKRGDYAECSALVREVVGRLPFLASVVILNDDGLARCMPHPTDPPISLADRSYFKYALATSKRVTGEFTVGRITSRHVLPIALRIGGGPDGPLGVAVAYISLEWLEEGVAERTTEPGSSLTIADRTGTIIARSPFPEKFIGTKIPDPYMHLLTEPGPGTLTVISQDGTQRVLGYIPVSDDLGLYVSAGHATAVAYAPYIEMGMTAGAIAFAGILAAIVAVQYTSRRFIARPVDRLVSTISAWRAGNEDARTEMSADQGEICAAGEAFDALASELQVSRAARASAEAHSRLLSAELDHRIKNLLTMVKVIASQTFGRSADAAKMGAFNARLRAIAEANDALRKNEWQSVDLHDLIRSSIAPFTDPTQTRVQVAGPPIALNGSVAVSVAMAIHELATNATKYGALSNDTGTVRIDWATTPRPEGGDFVLTWRESGGPQVTIPTKSGFGSLIIERVLAEQIGGSVDVNFEGTGLVCHVRATLAQIEDVSARKDRAA